MKKSVLLITSAIFSPILANAQVSAPLPTPIIDTIAPAKDIKFNGVMQLNVNVTNIDQGIFEIKQSIPVQKRAKWRFYSPNGFLGNMRRGVRLKSSLD